jgi:phosphate transport system protein|tara:strand:- start:239 stop:892 length:654 start_codon:yes stop_codon:yes gene_type:complete
MPREEFDKALNELQSTIETVQGLVEKMIIDSIKALETRDLDLANKVVEMDDEVDRLRDELEQKAIFLIASEQPLAIDLRKIITALRVIMELERMGDYAEGIAKINLRIGETDLIKPLIDIPAMSKKSIEMMRNCLKAYKTSDVKLAERVCQVDDEVDGLKDRVINELLQIMMKDPTSSRQATYLIFIAHNLERIADRSTNIAEDTIFLATGSSRSID